MHRPLLALKRTQSSPSLLETKEPVSLESKSDDIVMQSVDAPYCINISRIIRHITYVGMDSQHLEDAIYALMTLNDAQMKHSLKCANVTIKQFDGIIRASLEEQIPFEM